MSVNEQEKPNPAPMRRSSLKNHQALKFDPDKVLKKKRNSVSFGKTNVFESKALKAMFKDGDEDKKEEKEQNKEKHQQFLKDRKASIKNEFSLIKELMKKSTQEIIEEEDNDDEAKNNMKKNMEIVKQEIKEEESESSKSKSNSASAKDSDDDKSESRSNSKSPKNTSRNESNNEKSATRKKQNKHGKKSDSSLKESKLKNKINQQDEEKEEKEEKEVKIKETEKISVKKNKKPMFVEKKEDAEKKENEKEIGKEKEKEEEGKVRIMALKDAQNIELDKIAYLVLTDGNVIIIKNQGEDLVQNLLKIPEEKLKENKMKKAKMSQPLQQKSNSQKLIEIQRDNKEPINFGNNKFKNIESNPSRNINYNNSGNKLSQKTYSMITRSQNNSEYSNFSPNLSNFNKPIISSKSYSLNQETPNFELYSSNMSNFEKYNNPPLEQPRYIGEAQRNKNQKVSTLTKPTNYYKNQQTFHSNYLDSTKAKYMPTNIRNNSQNYADFSKKQYQNQYLNPQFNRTNYLNSLSTRQINFTPTTSKQIYDVYSQANPQFVKPNYNQNRKTNISQINKSYQFQKSQIFPIRNAVNIHSRFNSYQMPESFNVVDSTDFGNHNPGNDEFYNSEPKYGDIPLKQNKGRFKSSF